MNNPERAASEYSESKISRLTDSATSLDDRIRITRELYPETSKQERLKQAETDSKGRPVRYFRYMGYEELREILGGKGGHDVDNERIITSFEADKEKIIESLKNFLVDEGLYETIISQFEELSANPSLRAYRHFVQTQIPRISLFKLHIGPGDGFFNRITGLVSLSVGAPFMPPGDPTDVRPHDQAGLPVVELSIPSEEVIVHPLFKTMNLEMEKEVTALQIKPEWIVDIYNGSQDFISRFIKDPTSALHPVYLGKKDERKKFYGDYISEGDAFDMLQEWKTNESIADLIPKSKLGDIDENNPKLQEPLFQGISSTPPRQL